MRLVAVANLNLSLKKRNVFMKAEDWFFGRDASFEATTSSISRQSTYQSAALLVQFAHVDAFARAAQRQASSIAAPVERSSADRLQAAAALDDRSPRLANLLRVARFCAATGEMLCGVGRSLKVIVDVKRARAGLEHHRRERERKRNEQLRTLGAAVAHTKPHRANDRDRARETRPPRTRRFASANCAQPPYVGDKACARLIGDRRWYASVVLLALRRRSRATFGLSSLQINVEAAVDRDRRLSHVFRRSCEVMQNSFHVGALFAASCLLQPEFISAKRLQNQLKRHLSAKNRVVGLLS